MKAIGNSIINYKPIINSNMKKSILTAAALTAILFSACDKPAQNDKNNEQVSKVEAILPDDLEEYELDYDKQDKTIEFEWESENESAEYSIVFSIDDELSDPVNIEAGNATSCKITHKQLDDVLSGLGVGIYKKSRVYWAISAVKGDKKSFSEVRSMEVFRFYGPFRDPRDNEEYGVCRITDELTGDYSVWMRENTRATKYSDGTEIGDGVKFYEPKEGEDEALAKIYGGYYTWNAAVRGNNGAEEGEKLQGVCPDGWHVPTKPEWDFLINACTSEDNPGGSLKNPAYWDKNATNGGKPVTNSIGFDMAGSGYIWEVPVNDVIENGIVTYFWTATAPKDGDVYPWNPNPADFPGQGVTYGFNANDFGAALYPYGRSRGYNVRCVLN